MFCGTCADLLKTSFIKNAEKNGCLLQIHSLLSFSGGSEEYIKTYDDIEKFRQLTNTSSVMIARSAQFNCSVFRKDGLLTADEVIKDYLKLVRSRKPSFANIPIACHRSEQTFDTPRRFHALFVNLCFPSNHSASQPNPI